nr:uncharacterized protein CTRU02_02233 [Colletotrichum truncatum]KAF6799362.1 hypothetical protein CTRU02_02233 [Colletotrichum truncatum]
MELFHKLPSGKNVLAELPRRFRREKKEGGKNLDKISSPLDAESTFHTEARRLPWACLWMASRTPHYPPLGHR